MFKWQTDENPEAMRMFVYREVEFEFIIKFFGFLVREVYT